MEESKIREVEKRFDTITQVSWLGAVFKWPSIKTEISELKLDYSEMAREVLVNRDKIETMTSEAGELKHKVDLKEAEIKSITESLNQFKIDKKNIEDKISLISQENTKLQNKISSREAEDNKDQETINNLKVEKQNLENLKTDLNNKNTELSKQLSSLQKELEGVKVDYDKKTQSTDDVKQRYENKLIQLEEKEKADIEERHKQMELTWSKHEERVAVKMSEICERLAITTIEASEYEYQGRPDNAVMIANEYIIFDAKSPKKYDELGNFSNYLRDQAEKAKKYAKNEKVKKDIYLVVPENTLETLTTPYYEEGTYRVHIISINSLETILRSLQKIDEYENLKDIDPEEREAIFNFVGRLLHATKRRIQVDALYSTHVDSIIKEAVAAISNDTRDQIEHYEKASKFNPGRDEKKKRITQESSEKSVKDLQKVAFGQELNTDQQEFEKIESIPLRK